MAKRRSGFLAKLFGAAAVAGAAAAVFQGLDREVTAVDLHQTVAVDAVSR